MNMRARPPYPTGDPRAIALGRLGGQASGETRRRKAASDPLTRGLLGHLLTYATSDWMDRFGLTEPSWATWRIVAKVLDGLPLSDAETVIYRQLTGRTTVPTDLLELWAVCGRGSGKTMFLTIQALRAAMRGYPIRGIARVLVMAFVKDQANLAFEFAQQFIDDDVELRRLVSNRTRTSLTFAHGVRLETIASNWRSVRGYSIAAALCDEVAFWWSDETDANPAAEVLRAIRPGLGKCPGARLLVATSPWTEEGPVYDAVTKHHGQDASAHVLVLRAPTLTLNPSYDAQRIAADEAEDPESAAAEYGGAWRVAGGTLVQPERYDAVVAKDITERAPEPPLGDDYYVAAVDLSGGTGTDSAALSIQHVEDDERLDTVVQICVQDLLAEWQPPFDPGAVVAEIAAACSPFAITQVVGDQFSFGFAAHEFRRCGLLYEISERKTNECVLDSLAVINTKRCRLLDDPKLRRQYLNLRRDYASGGRPTIAETRKHDDLAAVTARGISAALGLGGPLRKQLQFR
jgi:hypothetical protein